MNFYVISKMLGLLVMTVGASMLPAWGWTFYYRDGGGWAIFFSMLVSLVMGGVLFYIGQRGNKDFFRREAIAVVGLGWLVVAGVGALPFYFYGAFPTFIDCYFESMSGFTTTGASVLVDYEALPKGLLFWRSFTHWLGGMGIIVLFVALLPLLGAGGRALMKSEVPGPVTETLTPKVKDTAVVLWKLYCFFTIAQTIALRICGLSWFDSFCHTFATLATGGFSTHPDSVGGYDNLPAEMVIVIFMLIAGTNFSLYYGVFRGKPLTLFKDPEWRGYIGIVAVSTLFVMLVLRYSGTYATMGTSFRYAFFQVPTLMTTTGFSTANFDLWPGVTKLLLVILMFIGGCAGSTGGGIKVVRWIILVKAGFHEVERIFSPRTVRRLRLGKMPLQRELVGQVQIFFFLWVSVLIIGILAVTLLEGSQHDLETSVTMVVATLNNIGPGLSEVGAIGNYAGFNGATKMVLSLLMVLGRLELYSILVLFAPHFWRGK
ncbi:MAG: TrkH family potassium uptake protein [Candidatus Sumerlaeota bacterium]